MEKQIMIVSCGTDTERDVQVIDQVVVEPDLRQQSLPLHAYATILRTAFDTSLHLKTGLIIAITSFVLLIILYIPLHIFLFNVFNEQGEMGVLLVILTFVISGLSFGIGVMLLLDRVVLTRMTSLDMQLRKMLARHDPAVRVTIGGNDELSSLAYNINRVLDALQKAQLDHQEQEAQAKIQEENLRVRYEFISTVSHELRTPLTPILGFVDLMLLSKESSNLTDEQRSFLYTIKENTVRMRALVNDLLDVGRIDAGKVELELDKVMLGSLIRRAVDAWQVELARKELQLTLDIDEALPVVRADGKRIDQVLHNLLSNAIKYTFPGGQIWIRAFARDEHFVEVQIEDTGVGLTPEQQSQLFTPFYRAPNELSKEVSGTGLGLCIVKSLVELHGGQVRVRSQVEVGSIFSFTLPGYTHEAPSAPEVMGKDAHIYPEITMRDVSIAAF